MVKALYDPIAIVDDEGNIQPYLVESIEPNEDFKEWTITLRDGVTFHNGDALTPAIMANHLKQMQLSPITTFAFDAIQAVGVVDEVASIQLADGEISEEDYDVLRRQVVVYMKEPWSTFPAFLASYQVGYVAHPDFVAGEIDDPIGTGPFMLDDWVRDDHMTVVRNPDYWREGLPYLDAVEFRVVTDPQSRYQSVASADLDLMTTNSPQQVATLGTDGLSEGLVLIPERGQGDEQMVILNCQAGPTADVEVRRALQLATDRAQLNEALYDGYFELADMPFSEASPWHADPGWPEPDPAGATELVDGWEAENGPLVISLKAYNSPDDLALAQAIQEQWEAVGVEVNIEALDEASALTVVPFGTYEAFVLQFMNATDPDEHYPFWTPANIGVPGELGINMPRYDSEVTAEALLAGRSTADAEARQAAYEPMWADWAENAPYLFLYHSASVVLARDEIHGVGQVTTPEGQPALGVRGGSIMFTEVWSTA